MLERAWRKGNPLTLLVGMQTSAATVENSVEIPLKNRMKIGLPYDPAIPLLGIHTEETRIERDTCTPMFIVALFTIARMWKKPRCPAAAAAAKSLQSYPTLCDPIDSSPPGSPVPGILQARTLEWVAISFSSAWKWKVKVKSLSRVRLLATPWTAAYKAPPSMGFSRQEYWSGVPLSALSILIKKAEFHSMASLNSTQILAIQFSSVVTQSCLTLCDPMDCSLQRSSVQGIFQARVLEWVAISFSRLMCYLRQKLPYWFFVMMLTIHWYK